MRRIPGTSLCLGNFADLRDLAALHVAEVTAVVDLADNEAPATLSRDLVYCRFPLSDSGGNADWIVDLAINTVAHLVRADVKCLVACSAGMNRSPAIAAAALAIARAIPFSAALQIVAHAAGPLDASPRLIQHLEARLANVRT